MHVHNLIFILNAGNELILQEKDGAECHVREIMYGTRTITVLIACTYFWHGKLGNHSI